MDCIYYIVYLCGLSQPKSLLPHLLKQIEMQRQSMIYHIPHQKIFLLPASGVAEDHQGIGEAVQVVVPDVQGHGLACFLWHKAPHRVLRLEVRQHWYPLQHIRK